MTSKSRPRVSRQTDPIPPRHRRTGKIARLPARIRQRINTMLLDGLPYAQIIKTLNRSAKHPLPHSLSIHSLSRWKAGGYQDWLRDQNWLEEMRLRLDFAQKLAEQQAGAPLDSTSLRLAITRLYPLLLQFDPSVLGKQLAREPRTYPRILNSLCKLAKTAIHLERRRDQKPDPSVPRSPAEPHRADEHLFAAISAYSHPKK